VLPSLFDRGAGLTEVLVEYVSLKDLAAESRGVLCIGTIRLFKFTW
jgi:hypothetical protein